VPLAAFAGSLATALGAIGPTLHGERRRARSTARHAGARAGAHPRSARLARDRLWIDDQEDALAVPGAIRGRRRELTLEPFAGCAARRVACSWSGEAGDDPAPGPRSSAELVGPSHGRGTEGATSLVLTASRGHAPSVGTSAGRAAAAVRITTCARAAPDDVARVARFVAGTAFGRRAQRRRRRERLCPRGRPAGARRGGIIPIDIIGGTSMGACIASADEALLVSGPPEDGAGAAYLRPRCRRPCSCRQPICRSGCPPRRRACRTPTWAKPRAPAALSATPNAVPGRTGATAARTSSGLARAHV